MKILVTGGTGFVGSHLVDALLSRGDEVVCLARNPAKAAVLFPERGPTVVHGSLTDTGAVARALSGVEMVYHVAGITAARNRREFFSVNTEATARLVASARENAPDLSRFVYVSSQAAAGPSRKGRAIDESHEPAPVSRYGESKLAGEEAVRGAEIPWTIVRPAAVYGPRDAEFLRLFKVVRWRLVPLMVARDQELMLVHVRDLVGALLLSTTTPEAAGKTYFAAHGGIVTAEAIILGIHRALKGGGSTAPVIVPLPALVTRAALAVSSIVTALTGKASVLSTDKGHEFLAEAWTCSSAALKRDTGWQAQIPHEEGWRETADWYRRNGWL